MKSNTIASKTEQNSGTGKISKRMSYHQAGYAVAIQLGNEQKKLPHPDFHIAIKPQAHDSDQDNRIVGLFEPVIRFLVVEVEGGRLVQNLPLSFSEEVQNLSRPLLTQYRCAFEADIINLLAGSLAEAKYTALRDDEIFNVDLVNFEALRFYNASSDIALVNSYMKCYLPNEFEREQKLAELFMQAFNFVDNSQNWRKISALAEFIHCQTKPGIIHCEEVIALLNASIPLSQTNSLGLKAMHFSR